MFRYITIHCSDSLFGDVPVINAWHVARGWKEIGYHFVILNGNIKDSKHFNSKLDGAIQQGRSLLKVGAHVLGHNAGNIGICLIGKQNFSEAQYNSVFSKVCELMHKYNISIENVRGHYEYDHDKTCPNINMMEFRKQLVNHYDKYTKQFG